MSKKAEDSARTKEEQPSSSIEKFSANTSLDNETLDYEDDLDEFDEKERRESKFESERGDKATNIEAILPQQKGHRSGENENSTSERGRGGHRGRYPGRGNWRGRGGEYQAFKLFIIPKEVTTVDFRVSSTRTFPNVRRPSTSDITEWNAVHSQSPLSICSDTSIPSFYGSWTHATSAYEFRSYELEQKSRSIYETHCCRWYAEPRPILLGFQLRI